MIKKVGEVDKSGIIDFIFISPTSFFAPPKLCSKEKVTKKRQLGAIKMVSFTLRQF